ncbi:MAG: manganese efflux pump MntP family protein [Eggerthellaceae bacterium]|nr:manganese efflux pump MntP family protein [Eggerthellaceae bacterium]
MGFIEILGVGIGLSMDAFAVAICKGLNMKKINWWHAIIIALFFGGFQAIMPLIGWLLGASFAQFIEPVDHWIAFVLLVLIGGKMLYDAFKDDFDDGVPDEPKLDFKELFMLSIATSIDALAIGISFAFLGVNIWFAITIIGITTFVFSLGGVVIGNQFGSRFERPAAVVGGIVLILIGAKILLEHLGIINF